jgi:RNA methyltransferase, TrmH family
VTGESLIERFRTARSDPGLVVLEGFHAVKHAVRFGADILEAVAEDPEEIGTLARRLAPDVAEDRPGAVTRVPAGTLAAICPSPPSTGVVALARRPRVASYDVLADAGAAPVVFLEDPRHPGNAGAAIRVAAAAEAAGVLTSGELDPWGPAAIRGAAGLQFAVPVARVRELPPADRRLVALDPEGEPLERGTIPPRAVLAFGAERAGLSADLVARADARLRIPMREGVSSLNLATAVAAVLYALRLD